MPVACFWLRRWMRWKKQLIKTFKKVLKKKTKNSDITGVRRIISKR